MSQQWVASLAKDAYLHGLCLTATLSRYSPFLSFLESQKGQL